MSTPKGANDGGQVEVVKMINRLVGLVVGMYLLAFVASMTLLAVVPQHHATPLPQPSASPSLSPVPASRAEKRTPLRKVTAAPVVVNGLVLSDLERRIAGCESVGNPAGPINWRAVNRASGAAGGFQFLPGTFTSVTGLAPPASDYPADVQILAFRKLYATSGTSPWVSSEGCWR